MRFKIDWASLINGSTFTVFALFYFVFEGDFPSTSPLGTYILRSDLTEGTGLGGLYLEGLIFGILLYSKFVREKRLDISTSILYMKVARSMHGLQT